MADNRNVTTGTIYVAVEGTGARNVTVGVVYVAIIPSADRNVTAAVVYVAIGDPLVVAVSAQDMPRTLPTVRLQQRDFSEFIALPSLKLTPLRWSWREPGGPDYAEIEVEGGVDNLWAALQWLRCPVTIYNQNGTPVWWGYVNNVAFATGDIEIAVALDDMTNKVAVAYSYVEAGSQTVGERRTTAWAADATSSDEYGVKEFLASVDGATAAQAEAVRDRLLALHKYPLATPTPSSTKKGGSGRLTCLGWWRTLDWRYYSQATTASVETTTQIADIVSDVGEFLAGTDIVNASGISSSEYRDGDSVARVEVEALLSSLRATVTRERYLRIETQAASGDDDWLLLPDGRFSTRLGAIPEPGSAILGWAQLRGIVPASANLDYMAAPSPFYIEENEYDAESGLYNWRARGAASAWELTRIVQG